MNKVIEIKNLTKYYGNTRGIENLNLEVYEKEIFGFIGPNGAGKSTCIRTLLGLIYKTSGGMFIFGKDPLTNKEELFKDIGYLPSEVSYYDAMRAIDLFNYTSSFYKKDCSKKINELIKLFELDPFKKIEDMSLGNKKKVGIIQCLLHSPKLIILDEPTSGLDPLMQQRFFNLLKEENKNGATILFSSHILQEVQKVCSKVAIIKNGKIIEVQKISEMNTYKKISFVLNDKKNYKKLENKEIKNYQEKEESIEFLFSGDINDIIKQLSNFNLKTIEIVEPDLEEIFMHHYENYEN